MSRRGLLRWTTAAAAQAGVQHTLGGLVRRHAMESAVAIAVGAALLATTPAPRAAAVLACAVWACVPLWVWIASRPWQMRAEQALDTAERDYLTGVAHDTWQFFARHVGPATHYLPPDNVQHAPSEMVAERTSPTNIGLYLLSVACAQRFGFITVAELLDRCEQTLTTLDQLARHRGHFLNWYDTRTLAPLLPQYVSTVDSGNLCGHLIALAGACDALVDEGVSTATALQAGRLRELAARSRQLAGQAQFGFLFNARRRLLHIGLRVAENEVDDNYYDLLASEARLASLWAIGKGDIPVAHWAALGRPFYAVGTTVGLRSWSGSMFEYLMPSLVVHEPDGSAIERALLAALREQIQFGKAHGVPWGVSECAYAVSDHTLAYQYAPQGVPRLALRRTPANELVVAPYATALAAQVDPAAAVANFRALEDLGARGAEGFIEALDYTPDRQLDGSVFIRVQTHMAHHQGMTLVALANVLFAGTPRRWTMHDARLEAVASLLQERVPREVSRLLEPEPLVLPQLGRDAVLSPWRPVAPAEIAVQPTLLLSNGRYSVALRSNGAGWSQRAGVDVSRWHDDALRDDHGNFFFLRRT
ncbi:MAG: glucoamylase family protein, partial [Giesbergeria sp.]